MADARGALFIFIFGAICAVGLMAMLSLVWSQPTDQNTVLENVSIYVQNTSVVNKTVGFAGNVSAQGSTLIQPLPILLAIFALAAAVMVMVLVVKKR